MVEYACLIWRSYARTHVERLQVIQSVCHHTVTGALWYAGNNHIHDDLGFSFLADHIRALI